MVYNAAKSILVNKEEILTKQSKSGNDHKLFDITVVSKHVPKISQLYILQTLKQMIPKQTVEMTA